jgi:hypothetical protein
MHLCGAPESPPPHSLSVRQTWKLPVGHEGMQLVDCGPNWSGSQQTPLAQSVASLHETLTPEEQLPPLYGSHVPPPSPFEQQYWVAVLHDALPQGTVPGSHAAPPSGA